MGAIISNGRDEKRGENENKSFCLLLFFVCGRALATSRHSKFEAQSISLIVHHTHTLSMVSVAYLSPSTNLFNNKRFGEQ